ncbi:MAG TPA: DUF559 domain-containing protein [Tahibacter sp.]|nr:DUF559 domain-containing protein [Tahibacter sp.]
MHGQTNAFIRRAKIARRLRRDATDAERRLWRHLRLRQLDGARFRRQHPLGNYVVDFVCLERKLVIEVDGGQHAADARDERRDRDLQRRGFAVLRFWNTEILRDEESVLVRIFDALLQGAADRRREIDQGLLTCSTTSASPSPTSTAACVSTPTRSRRWGTASSCRSRRK